MFDHRERVQLPHPPLEKTCPSDGHIVSTALARRLRRVSGSVLHPIWALGLVAVALSAGLIHNPGVSAAQKVSDPPPRVDERQLPPEVRGQYKVFRAKCGRCHTTERVLRADYDELKEWQEVIARMAKLRGANISQKDQEQITKFFAYYLEHIRSPRAKGADAPEREREKEEPKRKEAGA